MDMCLNQESLSFCIVPTNRTIMTLYMFKFDIHSEFYAFLSCLGQDHWIGAQNALVLQLCEAVQTMWQEEH